MPSGEERRRERPDSAGSWLDVLDGLDFVGNVGEALGGIGVAIAVIAFVVLLFVFAYLVLFPVLFFLGDLLLILLIAAGGVAVRVLFRRPWKIEARTDGLLAEQHSWGVVGVRASAAGVESVAHMLERGEPPDEIRLDR